MRFQTTSRPTKTLVVLYAIGAIGFPVVGIGSTETNDEPEPIEVGIPMRDGKTLAADVYRPVDSESKPDSRAHLDTRIHDVDSQRQRRYFLPFRSAASTRRSGTGGRGFVDG